jgi:anti-sigma factor RsiW
VRHLTCKEVILDYLADYLDARLSPEALADFERHLEGCAACRAYLATYEKTRKVTRQASWVEMPSEMKAHLRRFLLRQLADGRP